MQTRAFSFYTFDIPCKTTSPRERTAVFRWTFEAHAVADGEIDRERCENAHRLPVRENHQVVAMRAEIGVPLDPTFGFAGFALGAAAVQRGERDIVRPHRDCGLGP